MKFTRTTIGWLIAAFVWSIVMGVTAFSIGIGSLFPRLNYIAKPLVCPAGQLSYQQNVSNPVPGTTYTTAEWLCTDPASGSQTPISAIRISLFAGPVYGLFFFLGIFLIWYVYASPDSFPGLRDFLTRLAPVALVLVIVGLVGLSLWPAIADFASQAAPASPLPPSTDVPSAATPDMALTPAIGAPIVESLDRSKAVHSVNGPSLDSLANESYQPSDFATPGTRTYTVQMPRSGAPQWEYEWCAANAKILGANLKSIKPSFVLDGQAVPLTDFAIDDGPGQGSEQCHAWYVVLDRWPTGVHQLTTTTTFAAAINDGKLGYPAGAYIQQYTVYVQP